MGRITIGINICRTVRALALAKTALALVSGGIAANIELARAAPPTEPAGAGQEIRIGAVLHDLNGYGGTEDGTDVVFELRGAQLTGRGWDFLLRPRPHIGANINTAGATSSLYAGLTWSWPIAEAYYLSADFGAPSMTGTSTKKNRTGPPSVPAFCFVKPLRSAVVLARAGVSVCASITCRMPACWTKTTALRPSDWS